MNTMVSNPRDHMIFSTASFHCDKPQEWTGSWETVVKLERHTLWHGLCWGRCIVFVCWQILMWSVALEIIQREWCLSQGFYCCAKTPGQKKLREGINYFIFSCNSSSTGVRIGIPGRNLEASSEEAMGEHCLLACSASFHIPLRTICHGVALTTVGSALPHQTLINFKTTTQTCPQVSFVEAFLNWGSLLPEVASKGGVLGGHRQRSRNDCWQKRNRKKEGACRRLSMWEACLSRC